MLLPKICNLLCQNNKTIKSKACVISIDTAKLKELDNLYLKRLRNSILFSNVKQKKIPFCVHKKI